MSPDLAVWADSLPDDLLTLTPAMKPAQSAKRQLQHPQLPRSGSSGKQWRLPMTTRLAEPLTVAFVEPACARLIERTTVFILFGTRAMVKTLAMVTFLCTTSKQPAAHRVSQITRWFTLFFIPVFPIGRRYVLTCSACGQSSKLTKQEADEIVARSEAPAQESLPTDAS